MKVPLHIVNARRERLAAMISQYGYMPVSELCRRLQVSEATARRDLAALAGEKKIKRTYGGAVSEFENRYPSFAERRDASRRAKAQIASAALAALTPGLTIFLDAGTTVYAIAEAFRAKPVKPMTVVTSNLPVGEMLAAIPGVSVFLLAGRLLARQSTLLGEAAVKSLQFWRFDVAFLSAEGMDASGIWNSQSDIVEQQKVVVNRSARAVFCLDGSKLNRQAPDILLPWRQVEMLLTDVPFEKLAAAGIMIDPKQYWSARGGKSACPSGPFEGSGGADASSLPVELL
ncbi:MAG: DeoR/GlpR family DNA-binding transcription regulator [Chthoniobacteraceae bacterium]|nr:DeoR/GlpR family DNA-binding transcription regulator [Chthoniobacteraceae bacterium]